MPMLDEVADFALYHPTRALNKLMFVAELLAERYGVYETEIELAEFMEYELAHAIATAVTLAEPGPEECAQIRGRLAALDSMLKRDYNIAPYRRLRV